MASPLASPIPVINPGVDDIIAILFAIASPEIEILAYTVSYGNTDSDSSYLNILKAYRAIECFLERNPLESSRFPNFNSKKRPILARGAVAPLEGEIHSAQYFHGRDGLGDITDRHPELFLESLSDCHPFLEMTSRSGADVAIDILKSQPARSVTYVALGPLTTLALMMRKENQLIRDRIGRIVCMGGALDVPGNTSPVAEFNFFADPYAVKELLLSEQGVPLDRFVMLPLDITTPHEIPFRAYEEIVDPAFHSTQIPSVSEDKSPLTHFTSSFLERTREIMLQFGKDAMELHDIVAVWCATENPPFEDNKPTELAAGWQGSRRVFDIERKGELTRGMLVVDRREDESAYPLGANRSEAQKKVNDIPSGTEGKDYGLGIFCITKTPGPQVLLKRLLYRVWGCLVP
ncbi:Inosine/uridine-preferring nucleoside hydrolase domain-containing protein [Gymnopilus junonius]|uniref:Inosine/uridine-preferring nucleoside hydrolase domain-containing protein n=1 Tax=Gymnopilus junonius TaxID=109634 RepID=A0A9P5TQT3_GYMJU|nr:Inosine/uridine-preferring nucleoside hydrolase domain-containing protein [Gymnopilus junonius]